MIIFDCESDGLLDEATKVWIYGWTTDGEVYRTTDDPQEFYHNLGKHTHAGCHNAIRYDFPLFTKLHGYTYKGLKIDTLGLSWYLQPNKVKHGLESYGEEFGIHKVAVESEEWKEGDYNLMKERVTRDVEINWKLWVKQKKMLESLYE